MLHTDTMLRSVLKAENPNESDSFVMNAHATRKSPTARTHLPAPFTPAFARPCPPVPARAHPQPEAHGSTRKQLAAVKNHTQPKTHSHCSSQKSIFCTENIFSH